MTPLRRAAPFATLITVFLLVRAALFTVTTAGEYQLYFDYATSARQTSLAELHRTRDVEYPPLATLFGVAVAHVADALPPGAERLTAWRPHPTFGVAKSRFEVALGLVLFAIDLVCLALVYLIARKALPDEPPRLRVGRLWLYVAATSAIGLIMYDRQDLVVGFVALVALAAFGRGWRVAAYAVLAVGTAYKLVPVLLVPLWVFAFAAVRAAPDSGRDFLRAVVWESAIAGVLLAMVPALTYLFCGGERAFVFLTFHSARGLQLEAPVAWPVFLLDPATEVGHSFGSFGLRGTLADRVARMATLATVAATVLSVLVGLRGFWRVAAAPEVANRNGLVTHLAASSLLVWLAFILFNKVGSPQYLLWPAVLVPLLPLRGETWRWAALLLVGMGFTTLVFPCQYHEVLGSPAGNNLWTGPSWFGLSLLAGKSVVLAACFAWLAVIVWRGSPASPVPLSPTSEVV